MKRAACRDIPRRVFLETSAAAVAATYGDNALNSGSHVMAASIGSCAETFHRFGIGSIKASNSSPQT